MTCTTYLSHVPTYPVKEVQDMLEELTLLTGELWCAERRISIPEDKGFLGFGKREAVYAASLYKNLEREARGKRFADYSHHSREFQVFGCVFDEATLRAYLYGALAQAGKMIC